MFEYDWSTNVPSMIVIELMHEKILGGGGGEGEGDLALTS